VAVALMVGGPGATFWMIAFGLFSMSTKYLECSLGVKYRVIDDAGRVQGGPMRYLREGFAIRGLPRLGKGLAALFAVLCVGASFGGGNMFQIGQSFTAVNAAVSNLTGLTIEAPTYGFVMVLLTGLVIIGGVKSIARVADKIVPLMVIMYLLCVIVVVVTQFGRIPEVAGAVLSGAFTPEAGFGGFVGVLIAGVKRAVFSNEAGIGSAAVAHAAARTTRPVREGTVALLEPFVDTVLVCTLTATAILLSGALEAPGNAAIIAGRSDGTGLTMAAFGAVVSWFPEVIAACVFLFAFSTVISWSYYGERSATYLFGVKASTPYKVVFLGFVYLGAVSNLSNVLDFSDMMILAMCVPNMIGLYVMSGEIARDTADYVRAWKAGEFAADEAAAKAGREELARQAAAGDGAGA
jgi:AGCS family alanine or glycine:cation symporter